MLLFYYRIFPILIQLFLPPSYVYYYDPIYYIGTLLQGRNYNWDKWGNCLTKNSGFFVQWMIYKGVLCILLCWSYLSSIKLFQSYNSQPIPYVIVCRSSLSIKPYATLNKFRYAITWCSYTRCMFTLTTLLVRNGYLTENRVLPKK
jgi:hypothetical protein